ncbi:putative proline- glutamic acid- and leucine-rich protein 1-like [Scophthalmus maximus]|uniref:Putative proline-glutamic acid-and leucine-rich protein 1-like n=1 Tax=Scophthalmus maximus TaxID=52904 RepID=A0A2U9AVV8_SCOMX|nr:putative proline- glutamic acid- and leucine-rich protein 1-like [Scophthalmus maximus]
MLVKDSSSDLFEQHCLSWLRSLQQVIQSQAPVQTIQLAVNILKDLLQYSSQLAELAREVGLNSILGILTSLLGLKTECELSAMEGMMACMSYYPRACGSLRDKLGAYFLSKMDSTNKKTQEMACQCYGRLPCLGGLLDRGVGAGRAEGWTNQIHCLLATANGLLAQIYQGSETDGTVQYEGPGLELSFSHLDQSDPLLLLQLQHRYTAVCLALKHTLRVDPASAVRLPVRPVLNLVCRALAVSSKSINLTGDGSVRMLVLPIIHTNTLEVLSALITAVRSGMVQYTVVLQRLFSQTLSAWSPLQEAGMGQQRAYSTVRVSVYRTLELWVQVAGASASILQGSPGHSELLFSQLLSDITPGADSVKLRAGLSADVVPGGKPGPRRTKPLVIADAGGTSLQRKGDLLANQDTCLSALRALRQIILTSGTLLKDDIHKRLHAVVLPLCVRLQQQQSSSSSICESAGGVGGQYSSALSRRELYRLVLALVLVPSPCWPPPLTCAVSVLSKGRADRNLKVSTFCAEALTMCNSLLHPRRPSIALPMPPLTLKPTPTAPVLPSSQGPTPGLTLPTLLGGTTPGTPFPTRHSLSLGPTSLLGSLENHLSLGPGLSGQAPTPGDMILSPHTHHLPDQAGLGPPEGQRPVFVRYEKEEVEDVEISLASDSDDSVVIVPPGMLKMENQHDDTAHQQQLMASRFPTTSPHPPLSSPLPPPPLTPSPLPTPAPADADAAIHPRPARPHGPTTANAPAAEPADNEDSAVININSTDEEEEEEDMEDDEELEEEEEGMEEEDEDEEVSDFAEEEFYDGEEYEDYDEEELEEEEEEEEDGDIPPLEGAEDKAEEVGLEEGKVLQAAVDEGGIAGFSMEGDEEGGIEEIQTNRMLFSEDRMKESRAELAQEASASDDQPCGHREEQPAAREGDSAAAEPETSAALNTREKEETDEKRDMTETEQQETEGGGGGESDGEEGKGVKRKRDEVHREEEAGQGSEKKKLDDEAMASMLADFVACPPDDEDGASGSNRS